MRHHKEVIAGIVAEAGAAALFAVDAARDRLGPNRLIARRQTLEEVLELRADEELRRVLNELGARDLRPLVNELVALQAERELAAELALIEARHEEEMRRDSEP